ncbi:hypothetical protein D9611_005067 [Ephemerocybe angulata]|uniref:1-phosphatidylinositol-3-phosphate 5-kinase n=1 Tax=Ephemerocybe angulata TaxID=980116 RepID=A0A8H5C028_9AGAR|nr:hypothetical protein D9611_005067 [Tulosesus angulatus]
MESPIPIAQSPMQGSFTTQSSRSRGSTKPGFGDDVNTLTSHNPFAEQDEHEQSSVNKFINGFYSKMNSILPLSATGTSVGSAGSSGGASSVAPASGGGLSGANPLEPRRPSLVTTATTNSTISSKTNQDRPQSLFTAPTQVAPPLVSLTPAQSEVPTFSLEYGDGAQRQAGMPYSPSPFGFDEGGGLIGTSIPGFPIPDDTRSIKTSTSFQRTNSLSTKVMRRIRGDGLSKDYWMDDENAKECYDCKVEFKLFRRKHHCRICGQIFCSRCASKVIDGERYGHPNVKIRVCDLCLKDDNARDEDDDRRSVVSSATGAFPMHQYPEAFTPGRHPPSPFQLYGRSSDDPLNMFALAEAKRQMSHLGYGSEGTDSRPMSPYFIDAPDGQWEAAHDNPAPFRRAMSDDDGESASGLSASLMLPDGPFASTSKKGVDIPVKQTLNLDLSGFNSVPFPGGMGSPDQESPRPDSRNTFSRFSSAEYDATTPFMRSRGTSRLDSFTGLPGRSRKESTAYTSQLNAASANHLETVLEQMLETEGIPNIKEWEGVLLRMAMRITKDLTFKSLAHRQGQDMDVRRYVKIKKIPGGTPKDSEYVEGAVITKNVAHKQMSRLLHNPRVMLVTFPLEFHRVEGQYMHFGQIVRQEKEYLTNLASRIAALRPHVVLVEKSVSRIALDALAKHNIAVARTVKPTAVQTVARMTGGDVFSSMDKLALEPRLGHCERFKIQTFDHHLIPGRRKTYMRFEGCGKDMGCTIILRGGDVETLRKIKKVMRFLTFIVRNLKLEMHLWLDTNINVSTLNPEATPPNTHSRHSSSHSVHTLAGFTAAVSNNSIDNSSDADTSATTPTASITVVGEDGEEKVAEDENQLSKRITEALEPYNKTFISVSATLRFPPPYPIQRMKELDDELTAARQDWEDEIVRLEEQTRAKHAQEVTVTTPAAITNVHELEQQQEQQVLGQEDISAQIEALPSHFPATPNAMESITPYMSPAPMVEGDSYFSPMNPAIPAMTLPNHQQIARLLSGPPVTEEEEKEPLKTVEDLALQSRVSLLEWKREEYMSIWEWYLRKNKDDFVVEKYQCIYLREYTVPISGLDSSRPCFPPTLQYVLFYGENDLTLGQFIEKSVSDTLVQFLDPKAICQGKSCDQPLARHAKVFIHNSTRISIAVEQWDGQIVVSRPLLSQSAQQITTWSVCRICSWISRFVIISEEMQRYSFAKFLEAYFYPSDAGLVGCPHNMYQHHYRYFASKGMTIRFQTDPITLQELVFPPFKIRIRPETQLEIKNREFNILHQRNNRWYDGLVGDLRGWAMETATGEDEVDEKLKAQVQLLLTRSEVERREVMDLINKSYRETTPTDTLAINQVYAYRQNKVFAWQEVFDKLPRLRYNLEKWDASLSKRKTAFGSVRAMQWKYDLPGFSDAQHYSSNASEAEDGARRSRKPTGDSFTSMSSASDVSESESVPDSAAKKGGEVEKVGELKEKGELEGETEKAKVTVEAKEKMDEPPNTSTPVVESPAESVQPGMPDPTPATVPSIEITRHDDTEDSVDSAVPEKHDPDPDSDSTIGAARGESRTVGAAKERKRKKVLVIPTLPATEVPISRLSRLPRRSTQPNVAELVRKYSDYIPAQGVQELSKTAFAPMSESEQDSEYPTFIPRRSATRTKTKHLIARKPSTSDFEQGYAANVAPRLPRPIPSRRAYGLGVGAAGVTNLDSQPPSRMHSPEKRGAHLKLKGKDVPSRPSSPTRRLSSQRPSKIRVPSHTRERTPSRPPSASSTKTTFRRPATGATKVSNLANHWERITSREVQKPKHPMFRGRGARPVASSKAKVEVLKSMDAINSEPEEEEEGADSSSEADDEADGMEEERGAPKRDQKATKPPKPEEDPETPLPETPAEDKATTPSTASTVEGPEVTLEVVAPPPPDTPETPDINSSIQSLGPARPKREHPRTPPMSDNEYGQTRNSILNALSGFWTLAMDQDDPFRDPEHIFSDMVVRLDEPTSIIALALGSQQYREMLAKSRSDKRGARTDAALFEGTEAFMPDDRSVAESTSTWGVVNVDAADGIDTDGLRSSSSKLPWAIIFESGGLTISCTVLFPEQFDAIRRMFDCEKSIVESLARCVKWKASGGKSGSAFLKTQDDRFIAKELSRAELQTMETFAPAYFDYMSSAVNANRPTLLAKVFGCYKLTFKLTGKDRGPRKSKSTQMNLLVMENLFYDRRFARIYDLKGSTRNRHVQPTGQENEVLLDENLVEAAHTNPFYVREHSKRILRGALYNDSKFLADINVMDYSLVCGVDSQTNELVLGIVDYIRTYTWDKKLESWVKESTFLGGAGKGEPTIVTPKQYRQRFLSAMERYFPLVPDRWMKHKDAPEEDSSSLAELWPDW